MKKLVYSLFFMIFCCSCDSYLDIVPDNVATIDYLFRDRAGAEQYLTTLYSYQPYIGDPASDPGLMGGDDTWSYIDQVGLRDLGDMACFNLKRSQNINSPLVNWWEGLNQGRSTFRLLRDCNIFLENLDKVGPDLKEAEKERWRAEAKFLKAYYHYYALRMYGPIPLVKENLPIDAEIAETRVYRDKFDDCIDYIVQLIDEAVPYLPLVITDVSSELRRITQPIALAIKAELLVTAASPLFNHNPDYEQFKDNRGVYLFESKLSKKEKWERAAIACKNAIDTAELTQQIELYDFSKSAYYASYAGLSDTSKWVMTLRTVVTDRWNSEIIWGTRNNCSYWTSPKFLTAQAGISAEPRIAPTMRMVELFYSNNGVPIEEDRDYDYTNRFKAEPAPPDQHLFMITNGIRPIAKINMHRELRFYANLGFDGGYWVGSGRNLDGDATPTSSAAWPLLMLQGEASGNSAGGIRYSVTGYIIKKLSHSEDQYDAANTNYTPTVSSFPIIRLADLYLLYAEALNESVDNPTPAVYEYVDLVRARAKLKGVVESWRDYSTSPDRPSTQSGMRDIIRQERMIELAFEGKRFWDIRRWLLSETWLNKPIRGWNTLGAVPDDYYHVTTLSQLKFNKREYLWPIRLGELLRNPNLEQNPGW